jgi:putative DNA primase/helicase
MSLDPRTVARALGGRSYGNTVRAPGPGHSRQDDSLAVFIGPQFPDGFWVTSHAGDDPLVCKDYVRERCGIAKGRLPSPPPSPEVSRQREIRASELDEYRKSRQREALDIWGETVPIFGTLAEVYLRARGIPDEAIEHASHALRFHPRCWRMKHRDFHPAMISLVTHVRTNEPIAVHETFLRPDGSDRLRKDRGEGEGKLFVAPVRDGVVRLTPDEEVTQGLHLTEGIEDALSLLGIGIRPVWTRMCAGGVGSFQVLPGIEVLTIWADHDPPGLAEARKCAERWAAHGQHVIVRPPKEPGKDWNSVLKEAQR